MIEKSDAFSYGEQFALAARRELAKALEAEGITTTPDESGGAIFLVIEDSGENTTAQMRVKAAIAEVRTKYPELEFDYDLAVTNSIIIQHIDETAG